MNSSVWAVWATQAVREKSGFEFVWATFEGDFLNFFDHKKLKKPPSKVAQKNSNPLFSLTAWAAQTAQTEEFMFQNVA